MYKCILPNRIENFDRDSLPLFSYVEIRTEREYSAIEGTYTEIQSEFLVKPAGYLSKVLIKMWETIEIAIWGGSMDAFR